MKNTFRIRSKNFLAGLLFLSLLTHTQAAVIPGVTINAVSSEYTSGSDLRRATNMVNGVGLFGDLHTAVAPGSMWLTSPTTTGAVTNAFVTFDLGAVHSVSQMKVWNYNESGVNTQRGIQRADISIAGEDLVFTTNLANATFTRAPGIFTNFAQSFDFAGASARYVRINVKTNYYVSGTAENRVGLSKVQFIDNTVPPTLKLATRSFTGDRVTVQFSESVSSSTATNTANYSISDGTNTVAVLSAAMGPFNDVVTLKTATLNSNALNTLTVQNVFDASNIISVATTSLPIDPELVLWLKGDVGVTADGSGFISQWADQSGAGNHAIQITNGSQPTVSSDPVSGLPTVHFDGTTNQLLEITNNSTLVANRDLSIYLVMSADTLVSTATANGQSPISVCPTNVPGSFDLQVTRTAGRIQFLRGNGSGNANFTGAGALSVNQNYIISVVMQGTNATEYINGSFNGTASLAAGIAGSGNSIRLGVRQDRATTFKGSLAEVMVVRGALTDSEQTALNNYLGAKYGISVVSLAITGQPENATRFVGETATFGVSAVSGYATLSYQWQKGTNNISGATNSTYTTPTLSLADNNSTYRVIVTTPIGLSTNSASATLTVVPDTQAPTLYSAVLMPGSTTNIVVTFSEPVASASATLASNYSLNNGASVISAAMGSSTNQVILTTSVVDTNATYFLTARNVQDLFNNTLVTSSVMVLPSTLSLWVRADAGVRTNSSGQVSEWLDQSGNRNDASQFGAASLRPTLVPAAMNGRSVLRFDGASNYVQAASSPTLAITNDITIYAVVNVSDYATGREILGKTAGSQPSSYDYYISSATAPTRLYRGNGIGANAFAVATASPSTGATHILSVTMRGTNVTHYLDGNLNGSGGLNTTLADTGNPLRIGSRNDLAQYMKGDIAETFIFSSALSTNARQAIDSYLGFKYLPFTIAPQPQSVSHLEGETATFTVGATSGPAIFQYQWQRNFSNIPGATNTTYTTPTLTLSNNNDTYLAVISLPDGTTTTSDTATLTVSADTIPPTILSTGLKLWDKTQLVVTFSEAVNLSTATNLANYALDNGGIITAAIAGTTPNTIILTVSGLDPSTAYSLSVQNVQDQYGNAIAPATTALGVYPPMALWLKADVGVAVDGQNFVTSWADQSGNGNNALQVSSDTAPLFVTNAYNNLPVLNFNGTNQYLVVNHAASLAITGDISVYMVVRIKDFTSTAFEIGLLGKTGGAAGNQAAPFDYYLTKNAGLPRFYRGNGTVNGTLLGTTAPSTNGLHSLSVIMGGTTATHYLDGKTNGSGTISTTIADTGNPMGIGTRYDLRPKMNGDVAEVLLFSSALSDSDRQSLDGYLANKYAILSSPLYLALESIPPALNMTWPVTPFSLVLETTSNLSSTNWVAVTNAVSTVGGTNKVSVSTGTGSQFYRLRKP